jgi:hypothetical protein
MLKIVEGKVTSNIDANSSGRIMAHFYDVSDEPIRTYYASPGYREGGGGVLAIPEKDDHIIAFYDNIKNVAYYNSTIVGLPPSESRQVPNFQPVAGLGNYDLNGKPVKVKYQNQKGSGLCITNENTSFPDLQNNSVGQSIPPIIIDSVVLNSSLNKRISLDDSPQTDAIYIKNQHKDGIVISGDATKLFPAQMIQVKSSGPHNYTCMQSHMDIRVVEGTDITIENNSTGKMAQRPEEETWPNRNVPASQAPKKFGGIYLRSDNGDLSLASKALDGRVFIKTPNAQIQIVENVNGGGSDIIIKTNGNISFDAGGDISMKSSGSIRLDADVNVDINSGNQLRAESGSQTSISSGSDLRLEGGPDIHLNSGGTASPGTVVPPQPLLNDYKD